MTMVEACTMLGISRSAGLSRVEQAYRKKHNQLRLKLVPGNSLADRQMAQQELVKLADARQLLKSRIPKRRQAKPARRKTQRSTSKTANRKPETLAEAWEQFVQAIPLPKPIVVVIIIVVFLLTLISFFKSI